jgi:hypothetical protein
MEDSGICGICSTSGRVGNCVGAFIRKRDGETTLKI